MNFWQQQRVLVTGGSGFLGRHLVRALHARGCGTVVTPSHAEADLCDAAAIERVLADAAPTMVIHLAAVVGGIEANRRRPADFFYDNLMMGVQLLDRAWRAGVPKLVVIGTVCAYPKFTPVPFREEDLWSGYPEETNAPYGLAKKMLLVQSQAYRDQHGFNSIFLLPSNLYGPGDNFEPNTSHVIPALIRKCVEAKDAGADHVDVWGDGTATREFLYVEDAAEGILRASEHYDRSEPVNIGSGREIAIREVVTRVADAVGFTGAIRWDASKPNGQPRRRLDVTRAEQRFGFRATTPFEDGLRKTVDWYLTQRRAGTPTSTSVI